MNMVMKRVGNAVTSHGYRLDLCQFLFSKGTREDGITPTGKVRQWNSNNLS